MRALAAATGSKDAALGISDRRLQRLLRHLDTDADGLINYEDFARVWRMAIRDGHENWDQLSKQFNFLPKLLSFVTIPPIASALLVYSHSKCRT